MNSPNRITFILIFFLVIIANSLLVKGQEMPNEIECSSMELYAGETQKQKLDNPKDYPTRSGSTWALNNPYSNGLCGENCNTFNNGTNSYDNGPVHLCNVVTNSNSNATFGTYRLPVVYTILNDCTGNLPTSFASGNISASALQTVLDNMMTYTNDYFACQDIPIQLFKSTGHGFDTQADNSTRALTDATLCSFSLGSGAGSDNSYANAIDIPNVLNIYVAETVNGSNFCNGFAFLPSGPGNPDRMVMQIQCFEGFEPPFFSAIPTDPCNNPDIAAAFIHEVGHYLGLYHTHSRANNDAADGCEGAGPGQGESDCCNTGDLICDTDADPRFNNPCTDRSAGGNQFCVDDVADLAGCSQPAACGGGSYTFVPNTGPNIMSYNTTTLCRFDFTECQKAKMVDALVNGRTNLCCDDPAQFFANVSDANIEICSGENLPIIQAKPGSCYNWFDGSSQLNTAISSFDPNPFIDTTTPGVYTFYIEEANSYQNGNCRVPITITIINDPASCSSTSCQSNIALNQGWNIISANCPPGNTDIPTVWNAIASDVIQVKTLNGIYTPALGLDNIVNWDYTQGYQVKMANANNLIINGTEIDPAISTINLNAGWNIISYLLDAPLDPALAFQSIASDIIQVKDLFGIYTPSIGINTIGDLQVNQGYMIKMSQATTFFYDPSLVLKPDNDAESNSDHYSNESLFFGKANNINPSNQTFILNVEDQNWSEGSEIGIFNPSNQLVGSAVLNNNRFACLIYGKDNTEESLNGLNTNESYTVKKWDAQNNQVSSVELIFETGPSTFTINEITIAKTAETALGLNANNLGEPKIYPNPANQILNIEIGQGQKVNSAKILNVNAKEISQIQLNHFENASQKTTIDLTELSEGVYFIKIETEEKIHTYKFVVIR